MLKEENRAEGSTEQRSQLSRTVFKYMNKYYMVPMSRIGLLPWILNPLAGYIMVLQTTGRKSGKLRLTPLNYAIVNGSLYCMAGFGSGTDWLANLRATPDVEVRLPGTVLRGRAKIVTDEDEAEYVFIQILHNCGFASLLVGLNPFTLTDEKILAKKHDREVLVRIRPTEIVGGPYDPGGKGWVLPTLVLIVSLFRLGRRLFGQKKAFPRDII